MKIEKNVKNYLKIALISVGIGLLIGTLIASAATPSSTFYISSGVYPGAPSYTIWKEGTNYFAKDANGLIKYSGTNATAIIANTLQEDKTIFFKRATYYVTFGTNGFFPLPNNIMLIGEEGTVFVCSGGSTTTFRGADHPNPNYNITMRNMQFILQSPKTMIFYLQEGDRLRFEKIRTNGEFQLFANNVTFVDCEIFNPIGCGISVRGSDITIRNNRIVNASERPISVFYEGNRTIITENIIKGGCVGGITVESDLEHENAGEGAKLVVVSNNIIYDTEGTVGAIEIAGYTIGQNYDLIGTISGNTIQNCNYSINIERASGISVIGNNIRNSTYYGIKLYGVGNSACGNIILNSARGIWLPNTLNCTVTGNIVGNCPEYGIGLDYGYGGSQPGFNETIIMANKIWGATYGIWMNATCYYNTIIGCDTRGCTNGIIDEGSNNHVNLCWNASSWVE